MMFSLKDEKNFHLSEIILHKSFSRTKLLIKARPKINKIFFLGMCRRKGHCFLPFKALHRCFSILSSKNAF